jgi:hypothetical protein
MSSFPNAPRLIKGRLVLLDAASGVEPPHHTAALFSGSRKAGRDAADAACTQHAETQF